MKYILLGCGVMMGMGVPAAAQDNGDRVSTATVYACADISADADRLACYDTAVGRLKAAEETGEVMTVTRDEVEEVKRESFGFSLPSLPKMFTGGGDKKSDEIDEVTLAVARVSKSPTGAFLVYLENGQVWEQIDTKSVFYSEKAGVDTATIKSAAMGSFRMQLDSGSFFRVRRVQ